MSSTPKKAAPRRTMNAGRRIWVRLSKVEFDMLGLDEQLPVSDYDDSEERVRVAGVVIFAETYHPLIHIAVGNTVLRLPWTRITHQPSRV